MIQRFRKKPVVIEAWHYSAPSEPMPRWLEDAIHDGVVFYSIGRGGHAGYFIKTLEGEMRGGMGDWIVRGVQGELYFCKPDIFAATYESEDSPDESIQKAKLWMSRIDISRHIHPAMAGLLERYMTSPLSTCREWTESVNAPKKDNPG